MKTDPRYKAPMIHTLLRKLFAVLAVWPITLLWMGYALRHRERLPATGPAIVIANHNSHLDALLLITFFPLRTVPSLRIAAAADYFFTNAALRFLGERLLGLVPLERKGGTGKDPLAPLVNALRNNNILVLFPEGTRGTPDIMGDIKPGLWHLARRCPEVPVHPVYLHGPGRSLPKGSRIPVPLFADVCVGESIPAGRDKREFAERVKAVFAELRAETIADSTALHEFDDENDSAV